MTVKDFHSFKTSDLASFLVLMGLVFATICAILLKNIEDPDLLRAMRTAESLSGQLIAGGFKLNSVKDGSRNPAAVSKDTIGNGRIINKGLFGADGKISSDPWGRAYHYRFVENRENQRVYLAVWSDGPNQKMDTRIQKVDQINDVSNPKSLFLGDDLGVVRAVR